MSDIYILSNYGKLSKQGAHLVYRDCEGNSTSIFPFKTEQIVISGYVSITGEAFHLIALNKIPVFFNSYGKCGGFKLDYGGSKNVFLRKNQYLLSADRNKSLMMARNIVTGKIKNQLTFMQRMKRENLNFSDMDIECEKIIGAVKKIQKSVEHCSSIEKLRGFEGIASKEYFKFLNFNIKPGWAVFERRTKNPPLTNVNALLSFLYSLLSSKMESLIEMEGLDSMVGSLHELSWGKNPLAYDLMEEFRTPVADAVCCSVINRGIISESDFEYNEDGSVYLNENGRRIAVEYFENKIMDEQIIAEENAKKSYSEIMKRQVRLYKTVIEGEEKKYVSFMMR